MSLLDAYLDDPRLSDPDFLAKLDVEERRRLIGLVLQSGRLTGRWKRDPVGWVNLALNGYVTNQQAEILRAVVDHPRVIVPAGHSLGKSRSMARLICWWIDVHPPGEALVVSTAPTYAQIAAVVWKEVQIEHRRGDLAGRILSNTQWKSDDGLLVGFGRRPRDYDPAAFQGFHSRYVLVIIDECAGVPPILWEGTEKLATGPNHRVVAIGNTDYEGSYFHQQATSDTWHTIRLSGLESPHYSGEDAPPEVLEVIADPSWIEERAQRYGRGSPTWMRQVTGEFPPAREDGLIPRPWLYACVHPDAAKVNYAGFLHRDPGPVKLFGERALPGVQLGVDVAAGGADKSVIYERRGDRLGRRWEIDTNDSERIVDLVISAIDTTGATKVAIDAIGVGFGVAGSLARRRPEVDVMKVIASESPQPNPDKDWPAFRTRRDQLYWMARELSRLQMWDLTFALYDEGGMPRRDVLLVDDLAAFAYEEKNGLVIVQSKDEVRVEIGRSPDDGDAAILAFAIDWTRKRAVVGTAAGTKAGWGGPS